MSVEINLSLEAATAILNIGMEVGQIQAGTMPESDGDKLQAAKELVQLCIQQKQVADAIGHAQVPNYQKLIEVLTLAGVPTDPPAVPVAEPQPVAAAPVPVAVPAPPVPVPAPAPVVVPPAPQPSSQHEPGTLEYVLEQARNAAWARAQAEGKGALAAQPMIAMAEEQARAEFEAAVPPAVPAPAPVAAPQPPPVPVGAPVAAPVADEHPRTAESWSDAEGHVWYITNGTGGPQVGAQSTVTGEPIVMPSGFFKSRVNISPGLAQAVMPEGTPVAQLPEPPPPPVAPPAPSVPVAAPEPPVAAPPAPMAAPVPAVPPTPPPAPVQPSLPAPPSGDQVPVFPLPVDDDEGDEEYGKLLDQVAVDYTPPFMPAPMDLERPPTEMPEDLTGVHDKEQRRLHSQFNALAARARLLAGVERAKSRGCARLKDNYLKGPMREARKELGSAASVGEVRALALENDPTASTWLEREVRHSERAEAYETFLKFYSQDVEVLSRDWTMREAEEKGS